MKAHDNYRRMDYLKLTSLTSLNIFPPSSETQHDPFVTWDDQEDWPGFDKLTNLKSLSISGIDYRNVDPPSFIIRNLSQLEHLNIDMNSTFQDSDMTYLPNLKSLSILFGKITKIGTFFLSFFEIYYFIFIILYLLISFSFLLLIYH